MLLAVTSPPRQLPQAALIRASLAISRRDADAATYTPQHMPRLDDFAMLSPRWLIRHIRRGARTSAAPRVRRHISCQPLPCRYAARLLMPMSPEIPPRCHATIRQPAGAASRYRPPPMSRPLIPALPSVAATASVDAAYVDERRFTLAAAVTKMSSQRCRCRCRHESPTCR